jgi:hypothetical protein
MNYDAFVNFVEALLRDAHLAALVLRKSPAFTIVPVRALALAIRENAIIFTVLNALVIRPLNVPGEASLFELFRANDKAQNQSDPDYLDFRDRNRSMDGLVAFKFIAWQRFTEAMLIPLACGALEPLGSVLLWRKLSAWRAMPQFPNLLRERERRAAVVASALAVELEKV